MKTWSLSKRKLNITALEPHVPYYQLSLESLGQKNPPKSHSILVLIFTDGNHNSQISFSHQFSSPNPLPVAPIIVDTKLYTIQSFLHGFLNIFKLVDLPQTTAQLFRWTYIGQCVFCTFLSREWRKQKGASE